MRAHSHAAPLGRLEDMDKFRHVLTQSRICLTADSLRQKAQVQEEVRRVGDVNHHGC